MLPMHQQVTLESHQDHILQAILHHFLQQQQGQPTHHLYKDLILETRQPTQHKSLVPTPTHLGIHHRCLPPMPMLQLPILPWRKGQHILDHLQPIFPRLMVLILLWDRHYHIFH